MVQIIDEARLCLNDPDGAELTFQDADKSQLAMAEAPAFDRLAFALRFLETGLRMCLSEKSRGVAPFAVGQSILSSPVSFGRIAKNAHISRISREWAANGRGDLSWFLSQNSDESNRG